MMTKTQPYARTSAAAIAAALALSSTQTFAQDVGNTTAPPDEPAPAAVEPVATPDPLAPVTNATDTTSTTTTKTTTARRTTRAAAKPTPVTTRTVKRQVTTHAAAPAALSQAAAAAPAPPPPAPAAKPAPIVELAAKPAAPPPRPAAAEPAVQLDQNELMLGGGALALVALAAAAIAMRRRRRRHEEEAAEYEYTEPAAETAAPIPQHDPIFDKQPAVAAAAPSAFNWGQAQPAAQSVDDESDRRPGETWVERAYRGPSPANPSVSLRARLKRAAFFDKREREVAAGNAQPVDADAGLPEALDEAPQEHAPA